MRRNIFAAFAVALALGACEGTGNLPPSSPTGRVKLVNMVTDAAGIDLRSEGITVVGPVTFGAASGYKRVAVDVGEVSINRTDNGNVLGLDTLALTVGRRYSLYGLGIQAQFRSVFVADDTLPPDSSSVKVRVVHGYRTLNASGLDVYATLPTDTLGAIPPIVGGIGYALASSYQTIDTGLVRFRVRESGGSVTDLVDTTLAVRLSPRGVYTVVATEGVGGNPPMVLRFVPDTIP
ncbi:MAG TPA: DUF4397 domain-containing protein [Gemmatimonadales bacterium]|jgi:hypothetical protein|nr:DUF4397 domain-containing protein [Gemmatimonadales bacterium]